MKTIAKTSANNLLGLGQIFSKLAKLQRGCCPEFFLFAEKCYEKKWIVNRAAMDRARFLLCTGFITHRSTFLSVTRPKPPLGQIVIMTFNHATCDVYSPKAVKTLMYGKCYGYCFLYYVLSIFSFCFIEALDSKLTYTKKRYYVIHGMH